jgi:CO/xanthine dehydrogenase FAD-binding subunit
VVEALHPATLEEALELRARLGAIPFAGGTDLMVKLRRGAGALPDFRRPVLFLDRCAELSRIVLADGAFELGAMVTLREIAEGGLVHPALRQAVLEMGAPALRSVATLGGNICNASPAGDTLPFLYAFETRVRLVSRSGTRIVSIDQFITGPGRTLLGNDELLLSVLIPGWRPSAALWRKVGTRRANALTKVSIAAFADRADGSPGGGNAPGAPGTVARARIALGAVAPTVVRLREAEKLLEGAGPLEIARRSGRIRDAARAAVRPIGDQRSTAEYRREVAVNLVGSFVEQLFAGKV